MTVSYFLYFIEKTVCCLMNLSADWPGKLPFAHGLAQLVLQVARTYCFWVLPFSHKANVFQC